MLTFFIGSYTEAPRTGQGIYTVRLNTETGKLKTLHTAFAINPSYLVLSGDNGHLYCHTELKLEDGPMLRGYQVKEDQSLEFLNEQPIEGGYPCHLVCHENNLLVACYETGNVIQFPLKDSGEVVESKTNIYHSGSSINKTRQEAPHAHQVAIHPNGRDIYVCDLGIDRVKAYRFDNGELVANPDKDCKVSLGGGPRHMVFDKNGNLAYVLNEMTGDVSVLQSRNGVFKELQIYESIPTGFKGQPSASAIRMHPNGKFLYAANRNLEAISVFSIEEDRLCCLEHEYTKGEQLREFNITPDGQWLIACHQDSHDTVVYKIKANGKLSEKYRTQEILSPVCVVFPE